MRRTRGRDGREFVVWHQWAPPCGRGLCNPCGAQYRPWSARGQGGFGPGSSAFLVGFFRKTSGNFPGKLDFPEPPDRTGPTGRPPSTLEETGSKATPTRDRKNEPSRLDPAREKRTQSSGMIPEKTNPVRPRPSPSRRKRSAGRDTFTPPMVWQHAFLQKIRRVASCLGETHRANHGGPRQGSPTYQSQGITMPPTGSAVVASLGRSLYNPNLQDRRRDGEA